MGTREHIIPRALHGTTIFLGATCERCQRITSAFEAEVLQSMLGMYREKHAFPSYKKRRKEPKTFEAKFVGPRGSMSSEVLGAED